MIINKTFALIKNPRFIATLKVILAVVALAKAIDELRNASSTSQK